MTRRKFFALAGLAALAFAAAAPEATVVRFMNLEDLVRGAGVIVLGKVEGVESAWSDDGRMIVTRAQVTVERALKGGPLDRVVVEVPGGRVGDVALLAAGAPSFRPGERAVLFLEGPGGQEAGPAAPSGARLRVVGWHQGKLNVIRDRASGRDLVQAPESGAALIGPDGRPVAAPPGGRAPVDLSDFLRRVGDLAGANGGGGGGKGPQPGGGGRR